MGLAPGWIWAILVAAEGASIRQAVTSFRAPARFRDRDDEVLRAKGEGYAGPVTTSLAALIERVEMLREPAFETEDGTIDAQPIIDVLAMTDVRKEIARTTEAFESAVDALRCTRRCRLLHIALGVTLTPVILILPIAVWPLLDRAQDDGLVTGVALHVLLTVLGIAVAASVVLFALTIWAENVRSTALVAHRPDDARVG